MKLSLRFQDDPNDPHHHHQNQIQIVKAKIPLTIFSQPFISTTTGTIATRTSPSDLSFSLRTNFHSGPSLELSYYPTTTTTASAPFSFSLKSGLGLYGSPHDSPLVFSAHFSLSPANTPLPSFSLHFKPQFGNFSLEKSTFSDPSSNQISGSFFNGSDKLNSGSYSNGSDKLNSGSYSNGGVNFVSDGEYGSGFAVDGSSTWQELKLEPCSGKDGVPKKPDSMDNCGCPSNGGIGFVPGRQLVWKNNGKDGFFSGVAVMARTVLPVTKSLMVNLRWGVNFPADLRKKLPYLTVNKICVERVEKVKEKEVEKNSEGSVGDLELLKGMCFWMRRDLEALEMENREMKQTLEETRTTIVAKKSRGEASDGLRKKVSPLTGESASGFEQWRSKKSNGEENGRKESNKPMNRVSNVESELERAIKAASS